MPAPKSPSLLFALVSVLSISSCVTQPWPTPYSDDASTMQSVDSATSAPDLAISGISVRCGSDVCHPPTNDCCTGDHGQTGSCLPPGGCPIQFNYTCADSSACPGVGQVCCYTVANGGVCSDDSACKSMMGSQRLCASSSDCDQGEQCCGGIPTPGTPPYKTCVAGVCAI